ncbi:hypothetical protein LTR37_016488 [Vermiconidia calcicola]|uniref:Uncharacterized protein n=1 Tax=Vermiconidia calcicola TaxID=1690605 RepID=A0ACC3MMN1_9PEZI|nr:hypothetical protein LTR37_016488 [Vermiconidia calcicola]
MAAKFFGFCKKVWRDVVEKEGIDETAEEEQYPYNLRRISTLKKPARLPDTPTKAHRPPTAPVKRSKSSQVTRKCPHCRNNIKFDRTSGRVAKPRSRAPRSKTKKRWITVTDEDDEEFLVEDHSPTYALRGKREVCDD